MNEIHKTNYNFIQRRMLFIFHKYVCLYHNTLKGRRKKARKNKIKQKVWVAYNLNRK